MNTAVLSRPRTSVRRPSLAAPSPKPAPPQLQRECDRNPNLFDLPETPSAAVEFNPISDTDSELISLDDVAAEARQSAKFAAAAKKATAACARCPFLQACQRDATERISSGQRPQGEVRAGVAFNGEGMPDQSVHHAPKRRHLEQMTLDMELELSGTSHSPETDWLPADLEPVQTFDPLAVEMALDEVRVNVTVTQSYLDRHCEDEADGRVVLSYADEIEILRRGMRLGHAKNRLAQAVGAKWSLVAQIAHVLGYEPEGKFQPAPWSVQRRHLAALDTQNAAALAAAARREQLARDLRAIESDENHEMVLDIADRRGLLVHTGPRPLSARILRTTAITVQSAKYSAAA